MNILYVVKQENEIKCFLKSWKNEGKVEKNQDRMTYRA